MGNRQTVLFSAFTTDSTTRQKTQTPLLGDIPGLGALFHRKFDSQSEERLYFALSVEIVRQDQLINVADGPADATPAPVAPPAPARAVDHKPAPEE
jgi:type II secretory pathway component GspD/PulD (secretin)